MHGIQKIFIAGRLPGVPGLPTIRAEGVISIIWLPGINAATPLDTDDVGFDRNESNFPTVTFLFLEIRLLEFCKDRQLCIERISRTPILCLMDFPPSRSKRTLH